MSSLFKTLQPIGAKYHITLLPVFDGDNLTLSIALREKSSDDDKDSEDVIPPLQYSGPIADVEAELLNSLPTDLQKFPELANSVADLEERKAELEKELARLTKRRDEAKATTPATKSPGKRGPKPGKRGRKPGKALTAGTNPTKTKDSEDVMPAPEVKRDGVSVALDGKSKQADMFAAPAEATATK